jgi:hypothetical protein
VYELLYGEPFPAGIQTAENLQRHGVIDGVVAIDELRRTVDRALTVIADAPEPLPAPQPTESIPDVPAWDSVVASRRPDRPGVGHLLRHGATDRVLLSGTGSGEAATTLLALARFAGQPAVVLGQQRLTGGLVGPASLREARRGMALAAELRLPLVLVIDTAGPALSAEAEQGGLAGQIAQCVAELVTLDCLPRYRTCPRTRCGPRYSVGRPAAVRDRRRHRAGASRRRRRADRLLPATGQRHRRRGTRAAQHTRRRAHRRTIATLSRHRIALSRRRARDT